MSEWISVEDRLPQPDIDGDWVIVLVTGKYNGIDHRGAVTVADTDGQDFYLGNDTCTRGVTHWMRLPEPPMKGAEND